MIKLSQCSTYSTTFRSTSGDRWRDSWPSYHNGDKTTIDSADVSGESVTKVATAQPHIRQQKVIEHNTTAHPAAEGNRTWTESFANRN